MNILIFSRGYPSIKDPQWGCFERDQAKALQKLGHKVIIMSVDGRFRSYYRKHGVTYINERGIDIYNIYLFPLDLLIPFGYKFRLYIREKIALFLFDKYIRKKLKVDLIYAHYLTNIYLAARVKEKYNIPIVGIEHWSMLNRAKLPSHVRKMGEFGYGSVDQLISVSNSLRLSILSHFNIDSTVIHNMVNGDFFLNAIPKKRTINIGDKITIVAVGSLFYGKGYDVLIKAFAQTKLYENGSKVIIIGDGNEKRKLSKLIEKLKLENNIFLLGRKDRTEILKILYSGDLFVHPSRGENFSVAIIEALSTGLPVVATQCGGASECINQKNGVLVPIDNIDALAKAILFVYNRINEYDYNYIANECKSKYSSDVIAKQLNDVFVKVSNLK